MKPKVLAALRQSIAHWERLANGTASQDEGIGLQYCSLCHLFNGDDPETCLECEGCPVAKSTKTAYCENSPFVAAADAWRKHGVASTNFRAAAAKEVTFLKSLLPKKASR